MKLYKNSIKIKHLRELTYYNYYYPRYTSIQHDYKHHDESAKCKPLTHSHTQYGQHALQRFFFVVFIKYDIGSIIWLFSLILHRNIWVLQERALLPANLFSWIVMGIDRLKRYAYCGHVSLKLCNMRPCHATNKLMSDRIWV